jgi:hypothetical protein
MQAKHLHLIPDQYVASARLRKWCEENKNQFYVPEWLLKAWNISVNSDLSGAASSFAPITRASTLWTTIYPQTPVGIPLAILH